MPFLLHLNTSNADTGKDNEIGVFVNEVTLSVASPISSKVNLC